MTDSQVILDIKDYNKLKSSEIRAKIVIDFLFNHAKYLSGDGEDLKFSWDSLEITHLLKNIYPERFANLVNLIDLSKSQDEESTEELEESC